MRADLIRQMHERPDTRELAEVLMDVEADELSRFQVIALLEQSTMAAAAASLRRVVGDLDVIVASFEHPEIREPLDRMEKALTGAQAAFSGSFFGYHSRVYYRDFEPPPAGAIFSSEWGFMSVFSNPTKGEWVEHTYQDVIEALEATAGTPDLTKATEVGDRARQVFDDGKAEVVSVLTVIVGDGKDGLLSSLLAEAKEVEPLSASQAVRGMMPSGTLMSRDSAATGQGVQIPPHYEMLGRAVGIRDPVRACAELSRVARRGASHIERLGSTAHAREPGDRVFIGHGGSGLWRELKDFVQDRLHLPWDEFNRVPIAGVANTARLAAMLDSCGIAFLVLTAEDEDRDGKVHARQNVIHEAGLFQGRLGFSRAIILLEEGCDEFSNIQGLGQIRFPAGRITATFEEVRLVLEREGFLDES